MSADLSVTSAGLKRHDTRVACILLCHNTLPSRNETLFYVLHVYFGPAGVKRTRQPIPATLVGARWRRSWRRMFR